MKKSNIITIISGKSKLTNKIQPLKVEVKINKSEVILRQFVKCRIHDIYDILNFNFLPEGHYFLKIEGEEFTRFEKIKISNV